MQVHQVLHGYDDGHRLLAGSVPKDIGAARQLLVLSDASSPNLPVDHKGYLTGYPLQNTKYYAFARTWPAPEMPRPGCVWTHTLLIDLADLAVLKSPIGLLEHFRRPAKRADNGLRPYQTPINVSEGRSPSTLFMRPAAIESLLLRLYGHPAEPVLWASDDDNSEAIILAIWMQQWPRLRRVFRFCTFSSADRGTYQGTFDLQVTPPSLLSRATQGFVLGDDQASLQGAEKWIAAAYDDIAVGGGQLRQFLWQYGADTDGGRYAFKPLTQVFLVFQSTWDSPIVESALNEPDFPNLGSAIQSHLADEIAISFSRSEHVSVAALRFLINHIDSVDTAVLKSGSSDIARAAYAADPALLLGLLRRPGKNAEYVFEAGVHLFEPEDLQTTDLETLLRVFQLNPGLIVAAFGSSGKQGTLDITVENAASDPNLAKKIVNAGIEADAGLLAQTFVETLGYAAASAVIEALDTCRFDQGKLAPWVEAVIKRPNFVLSKLREGRIENQSTVEALAARLDYRYTDSERRDPWLRALKRTAGKPSGASLSLLSFLFARSLSGASNQPGKILEVVFDPLYEAAAENRISYSDWSLIAGELPSVPWWKDWDKCHRVVSGAARLSVMQSLTSRQFLKITSNERAFSRLVRETRLQYGGGEYLRGVLRRASKMPKQRALEIEYALRHL